MVCWQGSISSIKTLRLQTPSKALWGLGSVSEDYEAWVVMTWRVQWVAFSVPQGGVFKGSAVFITGFYVGLARMKPNSACTKIVRAVNKLCKSCT